MAIRLADALVFLGTDNRDLNKGLDDAQKKTQGFTSNLAKISKAAIGGAVAGAATLAAGALVAVGKAAFDVSQQTKQAAFDLQAQLGVSADAAAAYAEVAKQAWGDNVGESVEEVADTVALAVQQLGLLADDPALEKVVKGAHALRDVFDVDIQDSISTSKTLMDEFGLSGDEAFDLIAAGHQKGLNRSGDFIETIEEYGPIFSAAGFSADEMFRILTAGSRGGVLGVDKIADAIKEMGVNLNEGKDETKIALEEMGIDYETMAQTVRDGEATWSDYFAGIMAGLSSIEDPIARSQAEVAIFNTMAEDLGAGFSDSMLIAAGSTVEFDGAMASVQARADEMNRSWRGLWRDFVIAFTPASDAMLDWAYDKMPAVQEALRGVAESIPDIFAFMDQNPAVQMAEWNNQLLMAFGQMFYSLNIITAGWFASIASLFATGLTSLVTEVVSVNERMWQAGSDMMQNLWDGIKEKFDAFRAWWQECQTVPVMCLARRRLASSEH